MSFFFEDLPYNQLRVLCNMKCNFGVCEQTTSMQTDATIAVLKSDQTDLQMQGTAKKRQSIIFLKFCESQTWQQESMLNPPENRAH